MREKLRQLAPTWANSGEEYNYRLLVVFWSPGVGLLRVYPAPTQVSEWYDGFSDNVFPNYA